MPVVPDQMSLAGKLNVGSYTFLKATTSANLITVAWDRPVVLRRLILVCVVAFATDDADIDIGGYLLENSTSDTPIDNIATGLGFLNADEEYTAAGVATTLANAAAIDPGVTAIHNLNKIVQPKSHIIISNDLSESISSAGSYHALVEWHYQQEIPIINDPPVTSL